MANNYWDRIDQEAPVAAIAKCEDAAKQLITLVSVLSTIYIGLISFSDLLKQPVEMRTNYLFVLIPLPFWLASLILSTCVIIPKVYTVNNIADDYKNISKRKHYLLTWSYVCLIVSMCALIGVLLCYLIVVPQLPSN